MNFKSQKKWNLQAEIETVNKKDTLFVLLNAMNEV